MRNSKIEEREIKFCTLVPILMNLYKKIVDQNFSISCTVFRFVITKCTLKKSKIILKKEKFCE